MQRHTHQLPGFPGPRNERDPRTNNRTTSKCSSTQGTTGRPKRTRERRSYQFNGWRAIPGFSQSLIKLALIKRRQTSNVYILSRKSMTLCFFIHSKSKRAEAIVLIDSGATENFMNLEYAKYLQLPIKCLEEPQNLFNVDGITNKSGTLQFYTDLQVQMGTQRTNLRFFLTDLEDNKAILGYPWFAAVQPRIDWKRGWVDHAQLPIILRAPNAAKAQFIPWQINCPNNHQTDQYFIGRIMIDPTEQQSSSEINKIPK